MAYVGLDELRLWLNISDAIDDDVLGGVLSSAEAMVGAWCGVRFDSVAATYVFATDACSVLSLGGTPLASSTGVTVKTDTNDDGTYETTLTGSTYQLEPVNGIGADGLPGWPYTRVRLIDGTSFPTSVYGRPCVQITGTFGWAAVPANVKTATKLVAAWLWTSKANPSGVIVTDVGLATVRQVPQAERLLAPYRRGHAIVGMG